MTLLRWSTFLLGFQTAILIVLLFWISSDASICSTIAFRPLGKSNHIVSVFIDFPSNWQWDAPLHRLAYDYSCADGDGLHDHFRDFPWQDIFKLGAFAAPSEFCEWVQVGSDVYIPHRKYQVKHHSSPWFSAACAAAIAHKTKLFAENFSNNSNLDDSGISLPVFSSRTA